MKVLKCKTLGAELSIMHIVQYVSVFYADDPLPTLKARR